MNGRSQRVLEVYARYRFANQLEWYGKRIEEFETARHQEITISGVVLFLATVSGFLVAMDRLGLRQWWAVMAEPPFLP